MADDTSIDRLQRKLHARVGRSVVHDRRELREDAHNRPDVSEQWEDLDAARTAAGTQHDAAAELEALREGRVGDTMLQRGPSVLYEARATAVAHERIEKERLLSRTVRAIFIASFGFFVLSAGIASYFFVIGKNKVSCDKLAVEVTGPVSVSSGKELVLNVGILNQNPVPITATTLILEYPDGTRVAGDTATPLPRTRDDLGTLDPGEHVRAFAKSVMYGREQTERDIGMTVEFKVDGSNAAFRCAYPYHVVIATAPVSLAVDGLEEITSGQEITLTAKLTTNTEGVVPKVRLIAEYPFGFQFRSATPPPANGLDVWEIGDMAPGTERTVIVTGTVLSQSIEERAIKFRVGEKSDTNSEELASTLQTVEHPLFITKPFLALSLDVDGSTDPEVPLHLGEHVTSLLLWTNTLTYPIYDVEIEAQIPSDLIDPYSVVVPEGFFRSSDRTVLWTPQTDPELKVVEPGARGRLGLQFATKALPKDSSVLTPAFDIAFTVHARRVSDDAPVQETLVAQSKRTLKFVSGLALSAWTGYSTGPFANYGPHPPRVHQETTYTLFWKITNTTNAVDQVQVQGELPVYVTWLDAVSPENERVTYDPSTRIVTWNVGEVPPSTGVQNPAREVALRVSLTPSISQLGEEPDLMQEPFVRGVDRFTTTVLERTMRSQTTRLANDPLFVGQAATGDVVE